MDKEDFEQLKLTVKQWLFHTGSLDPTNYANELKLKFIEPREKHIEELDKEIKEMKTQIEKMSKTLLDLLYFEDNLDPYMYDCDDAQKGELLKPFSEARDLLKAYECKKCGGSGIVHNGYKGWHESPCTVCEGEGYVFGKKK